MRSRPASQLADDGEAVGTPVPAAYDPSSAEPPVTDGGARKSVAPAPDGREANESRILTACMPACGWLQRVRHNIYIVCYVRLVADHHLLGVYHSPRPANLSRTVILHN